MITIKVLRSKSVKLIIVPKHKELGVNKIWALIKVVDELNAYFLDYRDNELPEREFIWGVISTIRPEETTKLVSDARKSRGVKKEENQDELVEVDPLLFKEIQSVVMQKGIPIYFYFVSQNILVHPERFHIC